MKKVVRISAAVVALSVFLSPAIVKATDSQVVQDGNTQIVFEHNSTADLNMDLLRSFDRFAGEHQDIAHRLTMNPKLIDDQSFVSAQPQLQDFMNQHPDWYADFKENPGNYLARVDRSE